MFTFAAANTSWIGASRSMAFVVSGFSMIDDHTALASCNIISKKEPPKTCHTTKQTNQNPKKTLKGMFYNKFNPFLIIRDAQDMRASAGSGG